ncbi:putative diguanylate cyclase YcdT [compost metagenome]
MIQQVREGAMVARFGGEEFVLLLRTDTKNAERVAQRIRNQLREDGAMLTPGESITISFGIAPVTHPAQLAHALSFADGLLYEAKLAGRDRVHVAPTAWGALTGP